MHNSSARLAARSRAWFGRRAGAQRETAASRRKEQSRAPCSMRRSPRGWTNMSGRAPQPAVAQGNAGTKRVRQLGHERVPASTPKVVKQPDFRQELPARAREWTRLPHSSFPRNEGVPGSSPGVGSSSAQSQAMLMRTTSGLVINVLDQLRRRDCHRRGRRICASTSSKLWRVSKGGEWIVSVRKKSPEPATVRFRISFEPVS